MPTDGRWDLTRRLEGYILMTLYSVLFSLKFSVEGVISD